MGAINVAGRRRPDEAGMGLLRMAVTAGDRPEVRLEGGWRVAGAPAWKILMMLVDTSVQLDQMAERIVEALPEDGPEYERFVAELRATFRDHPNRRDFAMALWSGDPAGPAGGQAEP